MPGPHRASTATTPCPACGAPIPVRGERGACPSCSQRVRFVDAPEVGCASCGEAVPIAPGRPAGKCPACGSWTAADPGRAVEGRATCPRCGRRVPVPLDRGSATCPHCRSTLALQDTL